MISGKGIRLPEKTLSEVFFKDIDLIANISAIRRLGIATQSRPEEAVSEKKIGKMARNYRITCYA